MVSSRKTAEGIFHAVLGLPRMFVYVRYIIFWALHIRPYFDGFVLPPSTLFILVDWGPYSANGSFWIVLISISMVGHVILKLKGPSVIKHLTRNLIASLFGLLACIPGDGFNCIRAFAVLWKNGIQCFTFLYWILRGEFSGIPVSDSPNI